VYEMVCGIPYAKVYDLAYETGCDSALLMEMEYAKAYGWESG